MDELRREQVRAEPDAGAGAVSADWQCWPRATVANYPDAVVETQTSKAVPAAFIYSSKDLKVTQTSSSRFGYICLIDYFGTIRMLNMEKHEQFLMT